MLLEIHIENYAVVEKLRVRFGSGLNVLTGETGSGKSIVVDALGLLFGGRTSAEMLRSGAERARVSGIFETPAAAENLLSEAGMEPEEELLVEREILANGKSRAFVANRPVTAALLRQLAPHLGDIHGQHDQQRLFSPDSQLGILDDFAANGELRGQVASTYRAWRACDADLAELDRHEQEKLRLLDLWLFQRNEIESARLKPGEDRDLEAERRILQNVTKLTESANVAYSALYDAPESVYAQLRVTLKKLDELCRIDPGLEPVRETLKPADIAVQEASEVLRDYVGKLESDPERLESVEARLNTIEKLKRKYGATAEEILAFGQDVREKIESSESASLRRAEIEKRRGELASEFERSACQLTESRQNAAKKLSKNVQTELKSLAMDRTVFAIQLSEAGWSAKGRDEAAFLVSANIGEEPKPLEKVASGGELSRIALALKTCVTSSEVGRTLVFDEVDAGIGGTAAESVGKRLKILASASQVLCVTHLAQIAGWGDHHFLVEKRESNGRTLAVMEELTGDARTREIGRMLSGQRLTPEALKHAEQLIRSEI